MSPSKVGCLSQQCRERGGVAFLNCGRGHVNMWDHAVVVCHRSCYPCSQAEMVSCLTHGVETAVCRYCNVVSFCVINSSQTIVTLWGNHTGQQANLQRCYGANPQDTTIVVCPVRWQWQWLVSGANASSAAVACQWQQHAASTCPCKAFICLLHTS